jgi:hypothetical protein
MLIFTLTPFILPALTLPALAGVVLLIPALAGVVLDAPILLTPRCWRSRDRSSGAAEPAGSGDGQAGTSRDRSAAALGFPSVELDLAAPACSRTGEVR